MAAEADHNYKFNVTMTCGGCSGAVERVLKKLDGTIYPPSSHLPPLTFLFLPFTSYPLPFNIIPPVYPANSKIRV